MLSILSEYLESIIVNDMPIELHGICFDEYQCCTLYLKGLKFMLILSLIFSLPLFQVDAMKTGLKEMKKEYKNVNINEIEVKSLCVQ